LVRGKKERGNTMSSKYTAAELFEMCKKCSMFKKCFIEPINSEIDASTGASFHEEIMGIGKRLGLNTKEQLTNFHQNMVFFIDLIMNAKEKHWECAEGKAPSDVYLERKEEFDKLWETKKFHKY